MMRAAVIDETGNVAVERLDDPAPGHGEVVVAVGAVGICGTDVHILHGEFAPRLPIVPGHEFAGTVVAVSSEVTHLKVGDRVAVDPSLYCGHCYECGRGRGNLCENWNAIGVSVPGAAAEYVAVPARNCWIVPESLSFSHAALIEPVSCAVHGIDILGPVPGDSYLIYGTGTMGLVMMELAKRAGAGSVSVVDPNPARLETARKLGCTDSAASPDELADRYPRRWNTVIDCSGNNAAISDGLTRVGKGGTFLQFGVSAYEARATIQPYKIYNQEIRIIGAMAVLHSFERARSLLVGGALPADTMISDTLGLDDYPRAIANVISGVGRKVQCVLP